MAGAVTAAVGVVTVACTAESVGLFVSGETSSGVRVGRSSSCTIQEEHTHKCYPTRLMPGATATHAHLRAKKSSACVALRV